MKEGVCPNCKGHRLKKQSLTFFIHGINISEASKLNIQELNLWLNNLECTLEEREKLIAKDLMNEIKKRAEFLMNIGLDYLNLDRAAKTLSGGESQRIRIAAQLASQLTGVLYILDEPTIGLHPRDNERLINSLKNLVKLGNSVIVVEHDKEIMLSSDHIIDMGPGAGSLGGEVMEN